MFTLSLIMNKQLDKFRIGKHLTGQLNCSLQITSNIMEEHTKNGNLGNVLN